MRKNKKLVSMLLATLSGLSSINATEKDKNTKTQYQSEFKNNKIPLISKNKSSETQFPKSNKVNITTWAMYISSLFTVTLTTFLLKDKIADFLSNNQKQEPDEDPERIPNPGPNHENPPQDSIPGFRDSSIDNIKFSDFEKLVFNDSMVEKINTSGSKISDYYPECDEINISYSNPGSIMGKNFDEKDMRLNTKKYFCQDQNNCIFVKDMDGQLHCIGKIIVPSLKNLLEKAKNIENKNGTINIVYGNTNLLDIHNILDCKVFQFANPASNFNAIETLGSSDLNKFFKPYCDDGTQGPWFMKKCPWVSLFLLHVLNGLKNSDKNFPVTNNSTKNLFQIMSNGQFEFNLLGDYGIKTSAGYVENNFLPNDFSDSNKDELYRCLIVENAPVSLKGKKYIYSGDTTLIDIYIDATIPKSYGGKSYSKKDIKQHLFRHYMSIIAYCKSKGIKNAILSLIGCGVFNVPVDWHLEILSDDRIQNAIKISGTNFIINGYDKIVQSTNNKVNCLDIKNINSWEKVFQKLGIK